MFPEVNILCLGEIEQAPKSINGYIMDAIMRPMALSCSSGKGMDWWLSCVVLFMGSGFKVQLQCGRKERKKKGWKLSIIRPSAKARA